VDRLNAAELAAATKAKEEANARAAAAATDAANAVAASTAQSAAGVTPQPQSQQSPQPQSGVTQTVETLRAKYSTIFGMGNTISIEDMQEFFRKFNEISGSVSSNINTFYTDHLIPSGLKDKEHKIKKHEIFSYNIRAFSNYASQAQGQAPVKAHDQEQRQMAKDMRTNHAKDFISLFQLND